VDERLIRIERLGFQPQVLAGILEVSTWDLDAWISGELSLEQSDVIEVGLAMLEMHTRTRPSSETPTLRLVAIEAA
jgi:hypothetical protein